MNIDQELVKLFFTVANVAVPFVFNRVIDFIKSKSEFDAAIDVVSNLIKINVGAAKQTIEKALIEASEDGVVTNEELSQIKDLVIENVKKNLSESIIKVLSKNISNVDKYIEDEVELAMKSDTKEEVSIVNPDGTLNIDSVIDETKFM
ncbi:MAG: hypothetical protein MSA56_05000 [Clostridium sp.]|nr:hypothetical protein [Clostridium sp.]